MIYMRNKTALLLAEKITIFSNDPLYALTFMSHIYIFECENNPRIELKL